MRSLIVILIIVAALGIFMTRAFYSSRSAAVPSNAVQTFSDLSDVVINASSSLITSKVFMTLEQKLQTKAPSGVEIKEGKKYTARLSTDEGVIEIALNADATPVTANNFVYLARQGFYDGTIFHRVMSGFMIQGGDPRGDGTGGPAYRFEDEKFSGNYDRGVVAMANAGPNTNGSQFFIMHQEYPLPPDYVIFGKVVQGLNVVDKIATAPVQEGFSGENSTPITPVTVQSVEIIEE